MKEHWKTVTLLANASINDAIQVINQSGLRVALMVDNDNKLIGTITDGDIRRGLLRDLGLNSSIDEIVNRDPLVVPPELGRNMILQFMQANKVHQLPIVDEKRRVVGLHYDAIFSKLKNFRANARHAPEYT